MLDGLMQKVREQWIKGKFVTSPEPFKGYILTTLDDLVAFQRQIVEACYKVAETEVYAAEGNGAGITKHSYSGKSSAAHIASQLYVWRDELEKQTKPSNIDRCILNCDSPSYPPEDDEYIQCALQGCSMCRRHIVKRLADARLHEVEVMKLNRAIEEAERMIASYSPYMQMVDKLTEAIALKLERQQKSGGASESTSLAPHNRPEEHSESSDQ